MSTQKIPNSQKQIIQSNIGDYRGNLWSTFNIDLDSNPGVIKTSKRLSTSFFYTSDEGVVQAIQVHDGFYYVIFDFTGWKCSVNDDPSDIANWSQVTTFISEDLGLETDATSFAGLMLISLGTDIMSWDGTTKDDDWWSNVTSGSALTADKTHTMEVLRTGVDTLFVTDGNLVRYYNATAGHTTITLDTLMTATSLTPSLDRMWVGTYTEVENNAYVYEIRVGDDIALQAYEVEGRACLTMFTYKNTPFVITEKGYIQAFNGAGFDTVAQFPWATESKLMEGVRPGLVQGVSTLKAIHPKGARVRGKYCYIFVNTKDEYGVDKLDGRSPSGVWVLDLETYSLSHKYSLTNETDEYGQQKVSRSGPIVLTDSSETRVIVGSGLLLPGGELNGIWCESDTTSQGYFTTVRHESESVADAFEKFVVKHDTLADSSAITVKYKDVTLPDFPVTVNSVSWLNASSFTTTNALTNVAVGDEVEVIAGAYAGQIVTILEISGDTTKTVITDADFGVMNELSDVQIDRYVAILPETDLGGEYQKFGAADESSPSRQYKVILTGDVTVRETISQSNSKEEL